MKKQMIVIILLLLCISICRGDSPTDVYADGEKYRNVELTTMSIVNVNPVFGAYQKIVDENIFYSLTLVDSNTLLRIFGNRDTPVFRMALETINPCMALATTWGEAGQSYGGISLTTVMDFNPNTYVDEVDWISVTRRLDQVDSAWYCANAKQSYNINVNGKAYHMPVALLQSPSGIDRRTSTLTDLGVGPYQITSTNWDRWNLDNRVNPIWGFEDSLAKVGTGWINCGITPISDLTVYALLSMGHQGGDLINYQFGKDLINIFNREDVQQAFLQVGLEMYNDAKEKAYSKSISLSDINVEPYIVKIKSIIGIDFADYTGGAGMTNKGDYVARHLIRYVFYKYYYGGF